MAAPILAAGAAMAVGASTNMLAGYILDEHTPIGDGHYSRKDMAIDGTLGAIGVGGIFKTANFARKALKYRKAIKTAETAGDASVPLRVGIRTNDDVLLSGVKILQRDSEIRAITHGTLTLGGDIAKGRDRPDGSSTLTIGDRVITILDPISRELARHYYDVGPSGFKPKRAARIAVKAAIDSRGGTRCRCKDGSYSVNCC